MTWTGKETANCWCGGGAVVTIQKGVPHLFCFAHSYEAGMMAELPKEKPEDWDDEWPAERVLEMVRAEAAKEMERRATIREYRSLEVKMAAVREKNRGADSDEEDSILEEMDEVWKCLGEDEENYLRTVQSPHHEALVKWLPEGGA